MIEVFQMENGMFRWILISETGLVQVIGDDHTSDFLANDAAKAYRKAFRTFASKIDCYKHFIF